MLFRVAHETHAQSSLVFFGVKLGDVANACNWCVTDGNARSGLTQFTASIGEVGEVVDVGALSKKYWNDIEDTDLKRRRQAELLIRDRVPLSLIHCIVCKTEATLSVVRETLKPWNGNITYHVEPHLYFREVDDDH